MKWSRFVHAFPLLGILWHAIKLEKMRIDPGVISAFLREGQVNENSLGVATYAQLTSRGYIVEESENPEECLRNVAIRGVKGLQSMYLILTTLCNLRCSYCLYGSTQSGSLAPHKGRIMSDDVAREAISLFGRETVVNDRSQPDYWECITFYGGEPFINFPVLQKSVDYVRRLQRAGEIWHNVQFVVNTNGTLLTQETVRLIQEETIEVQVSIDGPEQIHNQVRMLHSGQGSFKSTIAGLKMMHSLGVDFVPLITVTEANMDCLAEFVGWLCEKFSIRQYGLNLLMHTNGLVDQTYGRRAADARRKAHIASNAFGATDKSYGTAMDAFSTRVVAHKSCGAGKKIVVFPQGELHVCQALEGSGSTAMGELPRFNHQSPNLLQWQQRNRFSNQTCLDCPAIGGCQGGCGASGYNATGDVCGIDPNYCNWMKAEFHHWIKNET